jgi:hypothetical protein
MVVVIARSFTAATESSLGSRILQVEDGRLAENASGACITDAAAGISPPSTTSIGAELSG